MGTSSRKTRSSSDSYPLNHLSAASFLSDANLVWDEGNDWTETVLVAPNKAIAEDWAVRYPGTRVVMAQKLPTDVNSQSGSANTKLVERKPGGTLKENK